MKTNNRNEQIQLLRGFGAITVYLWHTHWFVDKYTSFQLTYIFKGYLANAFFFFLAAYFIGRSFFNQNNFYRNNISFLKTKLKRIYPLYFLTTIFMALVEIVRGGQIQKIILEELLPHLLLIRSLIPGYQYDNALNGPGWFLSSLFFYWICTQPMIKLICFISVRDEKKNILFIIATLLMIAVYKFIPTECANLFPNAILPQHILVYLFGLYIGYNHHKYADLGKKFATPIYVILHSLFVLLVSNIYSNTFGEIFGTITLIIGLMFIIPFITETENKELHKFV